MSALATTSREHPIFIPSSGEELFGIITEPTTEPKRVALIMLGGGNLVPAMGRNRLFVRIARRAAALGYHALRLDYHGVGESTGGVETFRSDRPFVDDLLAGVRCLEERGVREIALAGWCFGARTALASADRIPGLRGVALLGPPVRDGGTTSHYLRRAFSADALRGLVDAPTRRRILRAARIKMRAALRPSSLLPGAASPAPDGVSPHFSDPLAKLAARGTPVLLAYGTDHKPYDVFRDARPELGRVLQAPGARIEERVIPGGAHTLSRIAYQDAAVSMLEEWLAGLDGGASGQA